MRLIRLAILLLLLFSVGCASDDPMNFCGDGVQRGGEQCDDGNQFNGDGCSANCVLEEP